MAVGVEGHEARVVGLGADFLRAEFYNREAETGRGAEVVAPFVVADSQDGGVGRQEDGGAAVSFGAADNAFLEGAVFHAVELDGVGDGADGEAGFADGLDAVVGEAGDGHIDAAFCGGAGGGELTSWVRHGLEAGGGDTEREGDGVGGVEDVCFGGAFGYVD